MKYPAIIISFLVPLLCVFTSVYAKPGPQKTTESLAREPYLSALSINAATGETLFEDNADAAVYPASVLKLMDLYIVLRRIEAGKLALDDIVRITPEAARMGGSQVYLDPSEHFSVEELLYALMVQSANDAATALAIHIAGSREAFVALMNETARELGMNNTTFYSEHGLPPGKGQRADVTTARDLAILCRELVKRPETFKYTSVITRDFRADTAKPFVMRNHNKLLGREPGIDGLKTGYFKVAGFSIVATAPQNGQRVITLVLGSGNPKIRDAKAYELLRSNLAQLPPLPEVKELPEKAEPPLEAPQNNTEKQQVKTDHPGPEQQAGYLGKIFLALGLGLFAGLGGILLIGYALKKRGDIYLRR